MPYGNRGHVTEMYEQRTYEHDFWVYGVTGRQHVLHILFSKKNFEKNFEKKIVQNPPMSRMYEHMYPHAFHSQKCECMRIHSAHTFLAQPGMGGVLDDFFFKIRVQDLIPIGNLSNQDFQTYINVGQQINARHLANLSTM